MGSLLVSMIVAILVYASEGRDMKTQNGGVYRNVTVYCTRPDSIDIGYKENGRNILKRVYLANMSEEVQKEFGYSPEAAKRYQRELKETIARARERKATEATQVSAASGDFLTIETSYPDVSDKDSGYVGTGNENKKLVDLSYNIEYHGTGTRNQVLVKGYDIDYHGTGTRNQKMRGRGYDYGYFGTGQRNKKLVGKSYRHPYFGPKGSRSRRED